MEKKIRIGICGYGNLGHGVELAVNRAEDMELVGVFSRRDLPGTASGVPAINLKHVLEYKDKIDVMILCGGSATDLIDQGPELAQHFVTVDSFDTHPRIPEHFANMEAVTKANNTAAIISVGWDPGLFSLLRVLGDSVLPEGPGPLRRHPPHPRREEWQTVHHSQGRVSGSRPQRQGHRRPRQRDASAGMLCGAGRRRRP